VPGVAIGQVCMSVMRAAGFAIVQHPLTAALKKVTSLNQEVSLDIMQLRTVSLQVFLSVDALGLTPILRMDSRSQSFHFPDFISAPLILTCLSFARLAVWRGCCVSGRS
jgi:hypothetical protein